MKKLRKDVHGIFRFLCMLFVLVYAFRTWNPKFVGRQLEGSRIQSKGGLREFP
ncbi:hypothetical protein [Maribacter cobaltidurans]|uniref:hypothetical protein n=1 Tax=Maribacter cobaltidurans TaxID=1178778 RepID=UPI0013155421|nr:hypothetical protein [Maribacter cobaltidurans]